MLIEEPQSTRIENSNPSRRCADRIRSNLNSKFIVPIEPQFQIKIRRHNFERSPRGEFEISNYILIDGRVHFYEKHLASQESITE